MGLDFVQLMVKRIVIGTLVGLTLAAFLASSRADKDEEYSCHTGLIEIETVNPSKDLSGFSEGFDKREMHEYIQEARGVLAVQKHADITAQSLREEQNLKNFSCWGPKGNGRVYIDEGESRTFLDNDGTRFLVKAGDPDYCEENPFFGLYDVNELVDVMLTYTEYTTIRSAPHMFRKFWDPEDQTQSLEEEIQDLDVDEQAEILNRFDSQWVRILSEKLDVLEDATSSEYLLDFVEIARASLVTQEYSEGGIPKPFNFYTGLPAR
jgi:hypothetical protein